MKDVGSFVFGGSLTSKCSRIGGGCCPNPFVDSLFSIKVVNFPLSCIGKNFIGHTYFFELRREEGLG
jgi:hypothetical protein